LATEQELSTGEDPAAPRESNPIREVLASRDFRLYWGVLFLTGLIGGIIRFAFVWMAPDVSEWQWAPEALFFSVGMPGLVVTLPAGAIADRVDRRMLVTTVALVGSGILILTAAIIWAGWINLPIAMLMAFGIGGSVAITLPALQAMVPQLVPPARLMNAIGIQNMGQAVSQIAGALVSGATIQFLGLGTAFSVWAILLLAGAILMWRVNLPPYERVADAASANLRTMLGDIRAGIGYAMGRDPLRSLIIVGVFMGIGIGVYGVLMPQIARDELGREAFAASILFGVMSLGMMTTSLFLASRKNVTRRGLMFLAAFNCFGPGLLGIGLSDYYLLTIAIMFIWGGCGGVLMTSQRTLLQTHTEPHMMGRVMSMFALTFNGLLPLSTLYVALVRPNFGPGDTLAIMGAFMAAGAVLIASRSALRHM